VLHKAFTAEKKQHPSRFELPDDRGIFEWAFFHADFFGPDTQKRKNRKEEENMCSQYDCC